MSDDALIPRAVAGDAEAFRALAARHRPAAVRIARAVLGDDAAEDVAQEMLLRLHAALPGFRREAELGTWVYRVTMNLCHDHLRREKRREGYTTLDEAGPGLPADPAPSPERAVDAERALQALRQALRRLPEAQREALMLRYGSELSYKEIAAMTHTPQGTVASRVFRALERLGEELEPRHQEILLMTDPRHDRLLRFLEGELDEAERTALLDEVEADPALAAELRSAARGMAAVERLVGLPGGDAAPSPAPARMPPRRVSPWWAVAAAAAAVLVAVPTTLRLAGPGAPPPAGASAMPDQSEPSFVLVLQGVWPDAESVDAQERARRADEYWAWAARLAREDRLLAAGDLRWEPGRRLGARGAALPGGDPANPDFVVGMYAVRVDSYAEAEALARACPHLRYGGSVAVRRVAAGFVTTAGLADWEE